MSKTRQTRQPRRARPEAATTQIDPGILDATIAVLADGGWDKLSLERVADAAGISRVTLWRQGITREMLIQALLAELGSDYRDSMWSVLTASGTARERLEQALSTLCEVAERHLDLLLASDTSFHRAWAEAKPRVSFLEPFIRISEDGVNDGTLRRIAKPVETADLLFNTVCWSYVHLRGRHGWNPNTARLRVVSLALDGIATRAS